MKIRDIEIKIGSMVRFIDDSNLYLDVNVKLVMPVLYGFYTVRGFSKQGFYLENINNEILHWSDGRKSEPGFGSWRFEPVADSVLTKEDLMKEARVDGVKIKIGDFTIA